MLLGLLAAAAATAQPTAHPPPGWTPPAWFHQPDADAIHAAWPAKALGMGRGGVAVVNCRVNIHGVTEDCQVRSETPPGEGFGAAALLLTPDFIFKPATQSGEPVPARVSIPVTFKWPVGYSGIMGPQGAFTVVNRPVWLAAPTFADIAAAYPRAGAGAAGYAALRCDVTKAGALRDCEALREEPPGRGFAGAARGLARKFRMEVSPDLAAVRGPIAVNVPVRLIDPAGPDYASRRLGEPVWVKVVDSRRSQALFPPAAAAKGLTTGLGVASCAVAADGTLTACVPERADPDGLGFAEAAVTIAGVMQMSLWTQEGGPVDGARLQLPIRFRLAGDTAAPSTPPAPTPK